jgi:tetratricopeptide (TPR) repeat protein
LALRLGKVRLDRGELAAARAAFARAAATPELRSPAQYYLGQVALLQRRFDDAVALLEDALEANPAATEAHYPLARAYQALGRDAEAKAHLQRFELRSPVIADPLLDELKASTQRALPSFERALHAVRKGDYRAAVDHFAAGLEIDPHNAAARVSYARVLYLTKQPAAAKQALEQALTDAARDPTSAAMAHFFAGVLEQAAGARDAAATAYRHALEQAPEHAGALFQLANLAFEQGHYAAAARRYEAALEADPDASPARLLALVAQARSGRSEAELIERLEALRATAPDDRLLAYALARLLAAAADETVRDPETAMAIAAELATSQPIPPHQRLVALADAARGRPDRAAKALASLREHAGWMLPPAERELLEEERAAYRDGRLPQPAWPDADPLLAPRPFDAARIMRDYPAAKPF